ncbi:MAG TPA: hypothetical protein VFM09_08845 [Marmoricola sp.]|nr:hypothetical protein [Marmoricola sp.]
MPGTHRARRPVRLPPILATLLGAALVLAVVLVVTLTGGSAPEVPAARTSGPPASSPASSPAAGSSKPATPAPTPTLPAVAPAPPQRMQVGGVPGVGFGESVRPSDGTVAPGSTDLVTRLADRGMPGSPATDTVVVLGDSTSGGSGPLDAGELQPSTPVVVETSRGRLTYRIDTRRPMPAHDLLADRALQGHVPGRLVLVAVRLDAAGAPSGTDVLAVAHLTDATAF